MGGGSSLSLVDGLRGRVAGAAAAVASAVNGASASVTRADEDEIEEEEFIVRYSSSL